MSACVTSNQKATNSRTPMMIIFYKCSRSRQTTTPTYEDNSSYVANKVCTICDCVHVQCLWTWSGNAPPILSFVADRLSDWCCVSFVMHTQHTACGELKPPVNGNVSFSKGIKQTSVASFACDPHYILQGSEERTCRETSRGARWSGTQPVCIGLSRFLSHAHTHFCRAP